MAANLTPAVQFAQHLASNNPKLRDKTLKKLSKWFKERSSGKSFTHEELLQIWKGLYYCMWMSDKPLIQEKLADKISEMIHCFGQTTTALMFIDVFFETMAREWYTIDRYRIEKFMMLVRRFLRQSFHFLKQQRWGSKSVRAFFQVLSATVSNAVCDKTPAELKMHVADIYLCELAVVAGKDFNMKKLMRFLVPWSKFLLEATDSVLLHAIKKSIFLELIEPEEPLFPFEVEYDLISDLLLRYGSREGIGKANRKAFYKLAGTFKDAAQGVLPSARLIADDGDRGPAISKADIDAAARRYLDIEEEARREKSKKRKKADFENEPRKTEDSCLVEDKRRITSKMVKNQIIIQDSDDETCNKDLKRKGDKNEAVSARTEKLENDLKSQNSSDTSEQKMKAKRRRVNSNAEKHMVKKISLPKFTVTIQPAESPSSRNSCRGFIVTPLSCKSKSLEFPMTKLSPVKMAEKQDPTNEPESTETSVIWDKNTSARTVYMALAKEQESLEETQMSDDSKDVVITDVINVNSKVVPCDSVVEEEMTVASVLPTATETPGKNLDVLSAVKPTVPQTPEAETSLVPDKGNGNRSQKKGFANFEKFMSTPPSFFRRAAYKGGLKAV